MKKIRKSYRLFNSTVQKVKAIQEWMQKKSNAPYTETEILESLIEIAYEKFWRDIIESRKKGG